MFECRDGPGGGPEAAPAAAANRCRTAPARALPRSERPVAATAQGVIVTVTVDG
jgi:hypothetical protein